MSRSRNDLGRLVRFLLGIFMRCRQQRRSCLQRQISRHRFSTPLAVEVMPLEPRQLLSVVPVQFVDPHPVSGNDFGSTMVELGNGNVVITAPGDNAGGADAGAVYLFNGQTGALISTLIGSHANDELGAGGVTALTTGNYVVSSPEWNSNFGAVTLGNGTTGVSGVVSSSNSLVGSFGGDYVGGDANVVSGDKMVGFITALTTGNYVVDSPSWNSGTGAVTFGNGTTGIAGTISSNNSLIGSKAGDYVGSSSSAVFGDVTALTNGNYVVDSTIWNNYTGAVTFGNGTTGVSGVVSSSNSLVGSKEADYVGGDDTGSVGHITALANGNYLVDSDGWKGNTGAVTFGNGTTGVTGKINSSNSLVGSTAGDEVGFEGITVLTTGNYLVDSPYWNGVGAVTFGSETTGVTGTISSNNSLVGLTVGDDVGIYGPYSTNGITALTTGNYVVASSDWNGDIGAATFGSGTTGVTGTVTSSNSLVGSTGGDQVGVGGVTALTTGNYVVDSDNWDGGIGAVTFGNGTTGIIGTVSPSNSLVGSTADTNAALGYSDNVGAAGITQLTNGNYVVNSYDWDSLRGAVTFGNGTTGVIGTVSSSNSLVGTIPDTGDSNGDEVGFDGGGNSVTALANGNYVVASSFWGGLVGAATFGNGTTGVTGTISSNNSLVGSIPGEEDCGVVTALTNGNYVVASSGWNGELGAVTFGNGTTGIVGAISSSNSLVGSRAGDLVGGYTTSNILGNYGGGVTALANGNYVVDSADWDINRGAVTFGNGTTGIAGTVSSSNSLVGTREGDAVGSTFGIGGTVNGGGVTAFANGNYVVVSPLWDDSYKSVTFGNGTTGVTGAASSSNSVFSNFAYGGINLVVNNADNAFYVSFLGNGSEGNAYQGSSTSGFPAPPVTTSIQITAPNVTYNGQAYSASAAVTSNGNAVSSPAATYTYYYATDTTFADPISAPTHVGNYVVVANYAGNQSYSPSQAQASFSITQANITLTIGNDSQTHGTAANLGNDLGTTINTGVNGENLGISYSSTGDTNTAAVGTYAIMGVLSNGTGLLSDYNVTLNKGMLNVAPPLPGGDAVEKCLTNSSGVVFDLGTSGNVYSWPGSGTTWTIMDSGANDIAIAGNGDLVDLHIGGPGGGGLYEFTGLTASSYVSLDSGVASFAIAGNGDVVDLRVSGGVYAFSSPSASSGVQIDSGVTKLAIAGNGDAVDLHGNGVLYEFTSLSASNSVALDSGVASFAIAGNGDVVDLHGDGGLYGFTSVSASSEVAFDTGATNFAIAGNGDIVDLHSGSGGGGGALNEFTSFSASSELKLDDGVIGFAIAGNGDVVDLHGDGGLYGFTSVSASSYVAIDSGVVKFSVAGDGNIVDLHATSGGDGGKLLEYTSFNSSSVTTLDTGVASFAVLGNGDVVDLHEDGGLYEFTSSSPSSYMALDAGVSKLLIAGNGAMVDLHWNGALYEFTTYRNAAGFVVLDTAVAGLAVAGNGDVVDLHGDGGLYEFTSPSAASYISIDSFVTNFAIAGNGDVVDLHAASGGLYEFTTYRSATGSVAIDTSVASFAIAGNGDVVDLDANGSVNEFTLPTASSAVAIDSGVTKLAVAGNGDIVDLHGNGELSEFTTYRSATKFVPIDTAAVNFAIAGNGDVVDLRSTGGLYEYPLPSASSAVPIDTGVASFLIAGDGDVVDRHADGGLYEFTIYRNPASYMAIDSGVTSFAIAGNGDVVDLRSSGGLYEYTGPIANIFQPLDSGVTNFGIAGNGEVVDLHAGGSSGGGLYVFTTYRSPASYAAIDTGVISFAIAGDGDVVDLHAAGGLFEFTSPTALSDLSLDNGVTSFAIAGNGNIVALHGDGGLYEFTIYRNPASYMGIDSSVTTFQIAGNGLVEDQRASGNKYIQITADGPVSQLISQFM